MDDEYGRICELKYEIVNNLINFQFTSQANTDEQRLSEQLWWVWKIVIEDLKEMGALQTLNNPYFTE
jgi:hypothetical protein